jgi:outer membrane protein insertion porin family
VGYARGVAVIRARCSAYGAACLCALFLVVPARAQEVAAESPAPTPELVQVVEAPHDPGETIEIVEVSEDEEAPAIPIRYFLERVELRGNTTRRDVIVHFIPIAPGELFDVDDPSIEKIRWRLLGTGWFNDVKLSLKRGKEKGWAVLVVEVKERNTLVIDRVVAGLSRVVTQSSTMKDELRPYGGLGVLESNLLGLGIGVNAAFVASEHQFGVEAGYHDSAFRGTGFSLTGRAFHNHAREFFGKQPLVAISCPVLDEPDDTCDPDVAGKRAVVIYDRTGVGVGTGHDMTGQLRYTLDWQGEYVDVQSRPNAASTLRGDEIVPIDFRIDDGVSLVSSLRLGLMYDRRDNPALTTRGSHATFHARFAAGALGSSYDFARLEGSFRHWFRLPWQHSISVGVFAGTVFGDAPFFYNFYAADLSDLLPSRVLDLNLDHRRTHNLLSTSIGEMDMEELAGRLDFEYQLPVTRSSGMVHGIDAYFGAGVFLLARREDLRLAIPTYEGLRRIPIDLTFDLGVQADTDIGLFKIGFSSLIGFLPDLGQDTP